MTQAPYLLPKARSGYRMGHGQVVDSMIDDGLWDAYGSQHMGVFGDQCASEYQFTGEAKNSPPSAAISGDIKEVSDGVFADEIVPIEVPGRNGATVVDADEEPSRFNEEKLRALRPAFVPKEP